MAELPATQTLMAATGDAFKSSRLDQMLRNFTASYKLYWLKGVFDEAGFAAHGPMGVDHFIPWSFVLHDEPWNLAPMFRDANSSKGSRLPVLGEYLRPFCEQQFDALLTLRGTGRHEKIFESYTQIDSQVMRYERTDAALESFTEAISKVVVPLHQIASNQGFPIWRPTVEYAVVQLSGLETLEEN